MVRVKLTSTKIAPKVWRGSRSPTAHQRDLQSHLSANRIIEVCRREMLVTPAKLVR